MVLSRPKGLASVQVTPNAFKVLDEAENPDQRDFAVAGAVAQRPLILRNSGL
jgi:hypothetical protein